MIIEKISQDLTSITEPKTGARYWQCDRHDHMSSWLAIYEAANSVLKMYKFI